jgi:hypothetical protein
MPARLGVQAERDLGSRAQNRGGRGAFVSGVALELAGDLAGFLVVAGTQRAFRFASAGGGVASARSRGGGPGGGHHQDRYPRQATRNRHGI